MTLVASWAALDQKKGGPKVSSIYFASDSRFTWPDGKKYDEGLKVFCSLKHPYIFAYCGDVTFPSISLERIIYLIDCGLLFVSPLLFMFSRVLPMGFNSKRNVLETGYRPMNWSRGLFEVMIRSSLRGLVTKLRNILNGSP